MKLAVFSDVHANQPALEACLAYADHVGVDAYVFLGDLITDCPYPRRTLDIVRDAAARRQTWFVRGNREDYLLEHRRSQDDSWRPGTARGSLYYTYTQLKEEDFAFLRDMPLSVRLEFPGCPPIRACHATPVNNYVLLFPGTENLESVLRSIPENTLFSGHSHIQYRYESHGRQLINPGSVGMPSHGQQGAQFALATCLAGRWSARLLNIPYDRALLARQFEESGLSRIGGAYTRSVLRTFSEGGNWQSQLVSLAKKISQARGGRGVTDDDWEEAAGRLGL